MRISDWSSDVCSSDLTQARFAHVMAAFDRVRRLSGFSRVEVPVFEATAVFARSLGETTDVVSKEMYTFPDRGGDSLTLRPDVTAGNCGGRLTAGWQESTTPKNPPLRPALPLDCPPT